MKRLNMRLSAYLAFGAALTALLPVSANAQSFVIYGATSDGEIYEVDPVAQTSVLVADFGTNINGLAWVPGTQRLYFAQSGGSPGDGGLYYWDRAANSFSAQLLDASQLLGEMDNGSYYDGAIWYVDGNGDSDTMYRLDINTLNITSFTNFDGTARTDFDFGDLVITSNGLVYGYATDRDRGGEPATFFNLDISSGIPGNYSEIDVPGNYQLGINLDGSVMYGTGGINVGTGNWFVVDTTTGVGDDIDGFNTPTFSDLSGSGAVPVNASAAAPEPGSLFLAGMVLVGGMLTRRRRA
jgi:hypothetical protein